MAITTEQIQGLENDITTQDEMVESNSPTTISKKGKTIRTNTGIQNAADAVIADINNRGDNAINDIETRGNAAIDAFNVDGDNAITDIENRGDDAITNITYAVGFVPVGNWATGETVDNLQQGLWYNNELYTVTNAPSFPVTVDGVDPIVDTLNWANQTLEARKTVARSLNVADSAVIYGQAGQVITAEARYIYNPNDQTTWAIPAGVGVGEVIVSVVGDQLETDVSSPSTYTMKKVDNLLIDGVARLYSTFPSDQYAEGQAFLDDGYTLVLMDKIGVTQPFKPKFTGQIIDGIGFEGSAELVALGDNAVLSISESSYNDIQNIKCLVNPGVTHTVDLVENGKVTGGQGSRTNFRNVWAEGAGRDNINIYDGNLGAFHDVVSINAGRDNIHFGDENIDNNGWTSSGTLDLRGAGRDNLHLAPGAGVNDAHSSKSHLFPVIVAQQSGRYNVYVGSRSNTMWVYSELGDIFVANASGAEGNYIVTTEGGVVFEDDNLELTDQANFVLKGNFDARYARAFQNLLCQNQLTIERSGRAGKWQFEVDETVDRTINFQGYSSGGADWFINLKGGSTRGSDTGYVTMNVDNIVANITPDVLTFVDGDVTPSIFLSNTFLCLNTAPTTITRFDSQRNGKLFTVQFDGNTTINNNSLVKLKSNTNETPTTGSIKQFMCSADGGNPIFVEIGNDKFVAP